MRIIADLGFRKTSQKDWPIRTGRKGLSLSEFQGIIQPEFVRSMSVRLLSHIVAFLSRDQHILLYAGFAN